MYLKLKQSEKTIPLLWILSYIGIKGNGQANEAAVVCSYSPSLEKTFLNEQGQARTAKVKNNRYEKCLLKTITIPCQHRKSESEDMLNNQQVGIGHIRLTLRHLLLEFNQSIIKYFMHAIFMQLKLFEFTNIKYINIDNYFKLGMELYWTDEISF